MKCPSEVELNEFSEDRLASQRRWEIQEHLDQCEDCRTDLDGLQWVGRQLALLDTAAEAEALSHPSEAALAALAEGSADPELRAELLSHIGTCPECAALFGALPRPQRKPAVLRSLYGLVAAAAVLLLIGAFALSGRFTAQPQTDAPVVAEKTAPKTSKPVLASKPTTVKPLKTVAAKPTMKPAPTIAALPPAAAVAKAKLSTASKPGYRGVAAAAKGSSALSSRTPGRSQSQTRARQQRQQLTGLSSRRGHRSHTGYDRVQVAVITPQELAGAHGTKATSRNQSVRTERPMAPAPTLKTGDVTRAGVTDSTRPAQSPTERLVLSVTPGGRAVPTVSGTPTLPAAQAAAAGATDQHTDSLAQLIVLQQTQTLSHKAVAKRAAKRAASTVAQAAGQKAKAQLAKNTGKTIKSLASKSTHHKTSTPAKHLTRHQSPCPHSSVAHAATHSGAHRTPHA